MKSIAANYKYYLALYHTFNDLKALAKSERILNSIPAQSKAYFLSL